MDPVLVDPASASSVTPTVDAAVFSAAIVPHSPIELAHDIPRQAFVAQGWFASASSPGAVPNATGLAVLMHGEFSLERAGPGRYLQVEFHAPADGTLHLIGPAGEPLDTADAPAGWAFIGLDAGAIATHSRFSLRFVADETGRAPLIGRMRFADQWGLSQRRRLPCYQPFEMMGIGTDFDAWPCCARQWLRGDKRAGNTREHSVTHLWNAPIYQAMRRDFLAGDFARHCRDDVCPRLVSGQYHHATNADVVTAVNEGNIVLPGGPSVANHDIDRGCNLACTMCRTEKILPDKANVAQGLKDIRELAETGSLTHISMSGAGEVTAMREIVRLLEGDTLSGRDIQISMTSNLTGFTPAFWSRISHNRFAVLAASIDGATQETYEAVRIGGNWDETLRAIAFVGDLRRAGHIGYLGWQYTVQKSTIDDVPEAIRLARSHGFDAIRLIAQLGALPGTEGNMFEDADMESLDRLYDRLDSVGALDDNFVGTAELGIADRAYRAAPNRIGVAQNVFDRSRWSLVKASTGAADANVAKAVAIMERLRTDIAAGTTPAPDHLSPHHADFVRQLLSLYPSAMQRTRDRLFGGSDGADSVIPADLAAWMKALLRLPAAA